MNEHSIIREYIDRLEEYVSERLSILDIDQEDKEALGQTALNRSGLYNTLMLARLTNAPVNEAEVKAAFEEAKRRIDASIFLEVQRPKRPEEIPQEFMKYYRYDPKSRSFVWR